MTQQRLNMYCVCWGKKNCTRPVLTSALDLDEPQRKEEWMGGAEKEDKEEKRSNKFPGSGRIYEPRKSDSAF